jgi:hypothetical protein
MALYARLSSKLQRAWTYARLAADLTALRSDLGPIDENFTRRDVTTDGDLTSVVFDIAFEKSPGRAELDFEWHRDHWRVVTFRVRGS